MLIDIIIGILLVIACIKGYQKGLIIALFSMIAFIVGLAAALKLSIWVTNHLKGRFDISDRWLPFVSFALVFLVVVLLVHLGGKLIAKTFQLMSFGWINRLG